MDVVMRRGDERVAVRADAEVCDVPEVEQTGEAHHDVQPESQRRVEHREQAVDEEVALVHPERKRPEDGDEEEQLDRVRRGVPAPRRGPEESARSRLAILGLGDPRVDADPRLRLLVGLARNGCVRLFAHTFWIARDPSSPLGRKSMKRMKRPKMTMSDHWPPT